MSSGAHVSIGAARAVWSGWTAVAAGVVGAAFAIRSAMPPVVVPQLISGVTLLLLRCLNVPRAFGNRIDVYEWGVVWYRTNRFVRERVAWADIDRFECTGDATFRHPAVVGVVTTTSRRAKLRAYPLDIDAAEWAVNDLNRLRDELAGGTRTKLQPGL